MDISEGTSDAEGSDVGEPGINVGNGVIATEGLVELGFSVATVGSAVGVIDGTGVGLPDM